MERPAAMTDAQVVRNGTGIRVLVPAALTGNLVPAIQATLRKELAQGARQVVFDLAHTRSLDSTGVALLLATHNSVKALGGQVSLESVAPEILHLLRTMRLVERLQAMPATGDAHG